jgi:hypothetical protein
MPGIIATSVGSVADAIAADGVPRVAEVATDDATATAAVVHAGATRLTALMRPFGVTETGSNQWYILSRAHRQKLEYGPSQQRRTLKVDQDWAPYKDQQVRCSELLGCC